MSTVLSQLSLKSKCTEVPVGTENGRSGKEVRGRGGNCERSGDYTGSTRRGPKNAE